MKKKFYIYNKFKYNLEKIIILNINNINKNFFNLYNLKKKIKYNIKLINKYNIKLKIKYFKFILYKNF